MQAKICKNSNKSNKHYHKEIKLFQMTIIFQINKYQFANLINQILKFNMEKELNGFIIIKPLIHKSVYK